MRFTHVRLLVRDFPPAFRFWRDSVGLTVLWGDEKGSYADFDANGVRVAIFSARAMAEAVGASAEGARGPDQAVLIFTVDDVDAPRLSEQGVTFVTRPTDRRDWGIRVAISVTPKGTSSRSTRTCEWMVVDGVFG